VLNVPHLHAFPQFVKANQPLKAWSVLSLARDIDQGAMQRFVTL
jgi:hypothetical protein